MFVLFISLEFIAQLAANSQFSALSTSRSSAGVTCVVRLSSQLKQLVLICWNFIHFGGLLAVEIEVKSAATTVIFKNVVCSSGIIV